MALKPYQRWGMAAAGCVAAGVFLAESASPPPPAYETTLSQEVDAAMQTGHALDSGKILVMKLAKPDQALLMAYLQVGWTRMGSADLLPPNQKSNAAEWCGTAIDSGGVSNKAEVAYLGAMAADQGSNSGPSPSAQFKKASDICMTQVLSRMDEGHVLRIPVGTTG